MTILDPSPRPAHDGRDAAKPDPRAGTLTLPGTFTAGPAEGHHSEAGATTTSRRKRSWGGGVVLESAKGASNTSPQPMSRRIACRICEREHPTP
jgi:hypothetical protein